MNHVPPGANAQLKQQGHEVVVLESGLRAAKAIHEARPELAAV